MVHNITTKQRSAKIVWFLTLALVGFGSVRLLLRELPTLRSGGTSLWPTSVLVALIVGVWVVMTRKRRRRKREEWLKIDRQLWEIRHNNASVHRYADFLNDIPPL